MLSRINTANNSNLDDRIYIYDQNYNNLFSQGPLSCRNTSSQHIVYITMSVHCQSVICMQSHMTHERLITFYFDAFFIIHFHVSRLSPFLWPQFMEVNLGSKMTVVAGFTLSPSKFHWGVHSLPTTGWSDRSVFHVCLQGMWIKSKLFWDDH